MNLNNYLFHTINKDSNVNDLYYCLDSILKSGYLFSINKQNILNNKITYNGNDYICLLDYVPISEYKVYKMDVNEYNKSKLNNIYKNYSDYEESLKLPLFKIKPLSKTEFFNMKKTTNTRDYYNYLDSISNLYPIDLNILYEQTKEEIYKKISNLIGENYGYFNANENAFEKFVINSNGITLMFNKNIDYYKIILIPNLPFEIEEKLVNEINNQDKRYSNLIGEVQVKDELSLENLEGIIIIKDISKDKIVDILNKNGYNVPIYILNSDNELILI